MIPAIFLSHGAPNLMFQDVPARDFLAGLGASLPRPRAIVVATAHWETEVASAGAAVQPKTIHDFGGFDDRLYQMRYSAAGDPALAHRIEGLWREAGLRATTDPDRGFDHGVWVPLMLMYPNADIPIVPLSVQPAASPEHHLRAGRALASLRAEDVLVIGSGSFTHDLRRFRGQPIDAAAPPDVEAFSEWFGTALLEKREADLLNYRRLAPFARENHPSEEHILPLFTALGAGGPDAKAECLHSSGNYGILRMDAYAFQ